MKKFIIMFFLFLNIFVLSFNCNNALASCNYDSINGYKSLVPVEDKNVLIYNLSIKQNIPYNNRIATGTVKNISNKNLNCISVILTYYDINNNIIGRRGDGTVLLAPNKTWDFSADICNKDIVRFEVSGIYYEIK